MNNLEFTLKPGPLKYFFMAYYWGHFSCFGVKRLIIIKHIATVTQIKSHIQTSNKDIMKKKNSN